MYYLVYPGTTSIMAQFDSVNPYRWPGWFIVALALFYIGIALIVFREIRPPPKLKRPKGSVSCHCLTRIKLSTQLQSDWKMQFTVSSIYTCSLDALPFAVVSCVYLSVYLSHTYHTIVAIAESFQLVLLFIIMWNAIPSAQ